MLIHSAVSVSSKENAIEVFETILGMELLYTFEIDERILDCLFGIRTDAHARVYDAGNSRIEVFVIEKPHVIGSFQHICLGVPNPDTTIRQAEECGLAIRRYQRPDAEVIFIQDRDGNFIEIKAG